MSQQNQGKLFPQVPPELREEFTRQQCPYCKGLTEDLAPTYYISCVCDRVQPRVYSHSVEHGGRLLGSNRMVRPYPYTPITWCWDPKTGYHNPQATMADSDYTPLAIHKREPEEEFVPPKPSESPSHDPSRESWNISEWDLKLLDDLDSEVKKIVRRLSANGFARTERLREYVRNYLMEKFISKGHTSRRVMRDLAVLRITHDFPRNTVIIQGEDNPNPLDHDDPFIKFSSVREAPENADYKPGHEPTHSIRPDETPDWELDITLFTTEQLEFIAAAEEQQIHEPESGWVEHLTAQRCYKLVEAGFSINAVSKRMGISWKKARKLYDSIVPIILDSDLALPSLKIDDPLEIVTPTESEREALTIEPMEHDSGDSHITRVLTYCCHTLAEKRAFDEYQATGVFRRLLTPVAERCQELLQQYALGVDENRPVVAA